MESRRENEARILLSKFADDKYSPEEKQKLYDLLTSSDEEKTIKHLLLNQLEIFEEDCNLKNDVKFNHIFKSISSQVDQIENDFQEKSQLERRSRNRRILIQAISFAAVFMIALFLGTLLTDNVKNTIGSSGSAAGFSEIKSPLGSKTELLLPDGTKVMLNAGSSLRYNNDFNLNNRDLTLTGEAYFKVAKNTVLPLYVNAGNLKIRAVGTEFNVKAYKDEEIIETTLVEGKVEITQTGENTDNKESLDLSPNQKAIYIKESNNLVIEKIIETDPLIKIPPKINNDSILISPNVNVSEVIAWTEGKLIIRGENLENLSIKLQRKYDVVFVFENEDIKKYRFSGILLDETIDQVLNVIKLAAPIEYKLEGKTVVMRTNRIQASKYDRLLKK